MNEEIPTLAVVLGAMLEETNLTAAQLARDANISPSVISRILRGDKGVRWDSLARIAEVFQERGMSDAMDRLLPSGSFSVTAPAIAIYVWAFGEHEEAIRACVGSISELADRHGNPVEKYTYVSADSDLVEAFSQQGFTVTEHGDDADAESRLLLDLHRLEPKVTGVVFIAPQPFLRDWIVDLKQHGRNVVVAAPRSVDLPLSLISAAGRRDVLNEQRDSRELPAFDRAILAVVAYLDSEPEPAKGRSFQYLVNELETDGGLRRNFGFARDQTTKLVHVMVEQGLLYQTDYQPGRLRTVGLDFDNPRVVHLVGAARQTHP